MDSGREGDKKKCHQLWMGGSRGGTHWCKHWWKHPDRVAATTVSLEGFSCCFFPFFSTCSISFSSFFWFFFFFNSPDLFQILMVLRFACYYLQLQTKVGSSTLLGGRAKLFWEGCLPNAWVADLKDVCVGVGGDHAWSPGMREHALWQVLCSGVYFYAT